MLAMLQSAFSNACLLLWHRIRHSSLYIVITRRLFTLLPFGMVLFLSSCLKDDLDFDKLKSPGWQPGVAVPLAQSSLSIADLMKTDSDSGNLVVDSNNFCTLYYAGRALELKASDLVSIPEQNNTHSITLNDTAAAFLNQTGHAAFSYSNVIDFATTGGALLDSVFYKEGNIVLQVNSRIPADIVLTVTVPGATYNEVPFSGTLMLKYEGTVPVSDEIKIDLTQYKIDLTDGGTAHNRLRIDYQADITTTGTAIQSGDRINFIFGIYTSAFRQLFGYFGQQGFLSPFDTLELSIFNSLQHAGSFTIAEPEIKIEFINSVGVPVEAHVVSMTGINSAQTSFTPATGFPNPLPVFSPGIGQIGQSVSGSFTLDKTNSNVKQLIQEQPRYLVSRIESTTNPSGNTGVNFITDSSRLAVDVEVSLPLYGTMQDFMLYDTLDFHYPNLQQVYELLIRSHIVNGFPFAADWQVYFADEQYNKLDSVVTQHKIIMPSAIVNPATGLVTGPSSNTVDNTLDRGRVEHIMAARKLLVKASISSFNNSQTNVKIYSDYRFTIHLGAIAKVQL